MMDGDEPRSFVTLYELEGLVYMHSLQLLCCLSVKVVINLLMLLLADVSIPHLSNLTRNYSSVREVLRGCSAVSMNIP